jgi:hypothetical protein
MSMPVSATITAAVVKLTPGMVSRCSTTLMLASGRVAPRPRRARGVLPRLSLACYGGIREVRVLLERSE